MTTGTKGTHYTYDDILSHPDREEHKLTLMLEAGDTSEHPGSAKEHHYLRGPARVEYFIYPDNMSCHVSEAPELAAEALAEAAAAWEAQSEMYTDSDPGDAKAEKEMWEASCALQQAAARVSKLIASGHFIVDQNK